MAITRSFHHYSLILLFLITRLILKQSFNSDPKSTKNKQLKMKLNLIAAASDNMGIGYMNELPWSLKKEMAYFNRMTRKSTDGNKQNAVVMGRKTWESIPASKKPLKDRLNIVLSSKEFPNSSSGVIFCKSWEGVISTLSNPSISQNIGKIWIVGGNSLYQAAMNSDNCYRIYLTHIKKSYNCDVFFPPIDMTKYKEIEDGDVPNEEQEENGVKYSFKVYENKQFIKT